MTVEELRTQLKEAFDNVEVYRKQLSTKVSEYDLQEQDLLHYIENEVCNAVDLVKIATKLKDIRKKRRVYKVELEKLQAVEAPFVGTKVAWNKDLTKFANKTYTNKSDILDGMTLSHKNNNTK